MKPMHTRRCGPSGTLRRAETAAARARVGLVGPVAQLDEAAADLSFVSRWGGVQEGWGDARRRPCGSRRCAGAAGGCRCRRARGRWLRRGASSSSSSSSSFLVILIFVFVVAFLLQPAPEPRTAPDLDSNPVRAPFTPASLSATAGVSESSSSSPSSTMYAPLTSMRTSSGPCAATAAVTSSVPPVGGRPSAGERGGAGGGSGAGGAVVGTRGCPSPGSMRGVGPLALFCWWLASRRERWDGRGTSGGKCTVSVSAVDDLRLRRGIFDVDGATAAVSLVGPRAAGESFDVSCRRWKRPRRKRLMACSILTSCVFKRA